MKRQHVYGDRADDRFAMPKGPGTRRPYPKEKKRETTPKWKADVLAALESKGISLPDAATRLKVDRKTIWQTLKTAQQTSSVVGALSDLAGVEPPLVEIERDDLDRVVSQISEPADRQRAAAIIRAALFDRVRGG